MKIIAKCGIEVSGYGIVRKGQSIDIPPKMVTERIAYWFVAEDGSPLVAADKSVAVDKEKECAEGAEETSIARTVSALGRDGIMRKLDDMGITYKPKHKTEYLAKLLLEAQGEI